MQALRGRVVTHKRSGKVYLLHAAQRAGSEAAERTLLEEQHVESAIFGAAELAKPALIPCCCWLPTALHTPEERRSRLAPVQGR